MPHPLASFMALKPYVPGLSIDEIRQKYKLDRVVKLASNENPLGTSPLVQEAIRRNASQAFRYPQGGNPRLRKALAALHGVPTDRIAIGNGSDEIIDLLIRLLARPGEHNIVCFNPCFSIYPIQAQINGVTVNRVDLEEDFSFPLGRMLSAVDDSTRLVFLTCPDNPSGYCPSASAVRDFAEKLAELFPDALLVIDEAYMDFVDDENGQSLLRQRYLPPNMAYLRTFSKSRSLAGLRLGYGIMPPDIADAYWRARLPFSVNILAVEAALASLEDTVFYEKTLETTRLGRAVVTSGLQDLGCEVWPSSANFVMFAPPPGTISASDCLEALLSGGVIVRSLKSYNQPDKLRVSIGNPEENRIFLSTLKEILHNRHA